MSEQSVVIIGLPESGKTTFLAALWHLVSERDVDTVLRYHNLQVGDASHLNKIAARWRDAKVQDRTAVNGNRLVSMNLLDSSLTALRVTFPDVPGEAYGRMWESRDCDPAIAAILDAQGVVLFIHADTVCAPKWVVDEVTLSRQIGLPPPDGQPVPWEPSLSPTQVQLVDLLQLLRQPPLDIGPRRLAVMLSAWDKASAEGLSPEVFVDTKLPLLSQYLRGGADGWTWRIYGLSAQGGDYDPVEAGKAPVPEAAELRRLHNASERIRLVFGATESHDLTEPLAWLMQ